MKRLLFTLLPLAFCTITYGQCTKSTSKTSRSNCTRSQTVNNQKSTHCNYTYRTTCRTKYVIRNCSRNKDNSFNRFTFMAGPSVGLSLNPANNISGLTGSGTLSTLTANPLGQADAFLGYNIRRKDKKSNHLIGLWGTAGLFPGGSVSNLVNGDGVASGDIADGLYAFRELELGLLLAKRFRLGAGLGVQNYQLSNQPGLQKNNYFTTSAGFLLPLGKRWIWQTAASALYGRDLQHVSIRPSTGVMLNLDFLKK